MFSTKRHGRGLGLVAHAPSDLSDVRFPHSRSQSCDPLGQRLGSRALANQSSPELSIRGAGQEDRSSGNENEISIEKVTSKDHPCNISVGLFTKNLP